MSEVVRYATTAPPRPHQPQARPRLRLQRRHLAAIMTAVLLLCFLVWCGHLAFGPAQELSGMAVLTLAVFGSAIWLWIFTSIDDTYVALGAAVLLVMMGTLPTDKLFSSLGEDTVWLLLAAFVISAGVTSSGLATRGAVFIVTGVSSVRVLFHLLTTVLVATAFAVPATSGRAALTVPVFVALANVLREQRRIVVALALTFPSVILLSAVGSYLGAGAHLITSQILQASDYPGFSFAGWLVYGIPLALVSSPLCTELILWLFTSRADRRHRLSINVDDVQAFSEVPLSGPLTVAQSRAALLISAVVALWCTEPLHGLHPAVVALLGALLMASPRYGSVQIGKALKGVPWSLLLFMAATLTLGTALVGSGAAQWLAVKLLAPVARLGAWAGVGFVIMVVILSTAAHLVIQSRSARSAVLIPLVVSLAPQVGVDPVGIAFASTAAAGFCHTLTSSAKPVTLFSGIEGVDTYTPKDLLRLSAFLAPTMVVLILLFSFIIWPLMGMPVLAK